MTSQCKNWQGKNYLFFQVHLKQLQTQFLQQEGNLEIIFSRCFISLVKRLKLKL